MYQYFDHTLRHFKINASQLARQANISPAMLSKFRSGKSNISTENLDQLLEKIDQIAPGSRRYFCMLLAGHNPQSLSEQIQFCSPEELAVVLNSVADRVATELVSGRAVNSQELVPTGVAD